MKSHKEMLLAVAALSLILCVAVVRADYEHPEERPDDPKILSRDVKCLVCKATIDEMQRQIAKEDPRKKVEVSGFRMDSQAPKSVQMIRSETYLTELMETVCKKMDDYAKARHKQSRKLTIIKFTTETGGMNPMMSEVDFVYDGDLNKSLEHFCLEVLEDHEETFLDFFMRDSLPKNVEQHICTQAAGFCDAEDDSEDYFDEDDSKDEL